MSFCAPPRAKSINARSLRSGRRGCKTCLWLAMIRLKRVSSASSVRSLYAGISLLRYSSLLHRPTNDSSLAVPFGAPRNSCRTAARRSLGRAPICRQQLSNLSDVVGRPPTRPAAADGRPYPSSSRPVGCRSSLSADCCRRRRRCRACIHPVARTRHASALRRIGIATRYEYDTIRYEMLF